MGVAIHLHKITQGNFFVSLGSGEYSCKELIGGDGRGQRQSFPSAGDDFIESIFSNDANLTAHTYIRSESFCEELLLRLRKNTQD
jgi:hypothetical protein